MHFDHDHLELLQRRPGSSQDRFVLARFNGQIVLPFRCVAEAFVVRFEKTPTEECQC